MINAFNDPNLLCIASEMLLNCFNFSVSDALGWNAFFLFVLSTASGYHGPRPIPVSVT